MSDERELSATPNRKLEKLLSETQSEQVEAIKARKHRWAWQATEDIDYLLAELDRIRTDRNILSKANADLLAELDQAREQLEETNVSATAYREDRDQAREREKWLRDLFFEHVGTDPENVDPDGPALAAQPEAPQRKESTTQKAQRQMDEFFEHQDRKNYRTASGGGIPPEEIDSDAAVRGEVKRKKREAPQDASAARICPGCLKWLDHGFVDGRCPLCGHVWAPQEDEQHRSLKGLGL